MSLEQWKNTQKYVIQEEEVYQKHLLKWCVSVQSMDQVIAQKIEGVKLHHEQGSQMGLSVL